MNSDLPKTLHRVGGLSIAQRIVDACAAAGTAKPLVVVGHKAEKIKEALGDQCSYVHMPVLSGTASAVALALPRVTAEAVVILNGDHPFFQSQSLKKCITAQQTSGAPLVMGTVTMPSFDGWYSTFLHFGRIIRKDGVPAGIVEYKNADERQRAICEVNPSVYCVDVKWLATALERIVPNKITGEYHLTDIVSLAAADRKRIETVDLSPEEGFGVNSQEDLAEAQRIAAKQS